MKKIVFAMAALFIGATTLTSCRETTTETETVVEETETTSEEAVEETETAEEVEGEVTTEVDATATEAGIEN